MTPDLCTLNIDVRTTPTFNDIAVSTLLDHAITQVDQHWSNTRPTLVQLTTRWSAYALPVGSPLRTTLLRLAHAFGVDAEPKIAGPSNIGNYLAGLGIPATAGFGVAYTGLHATDERIKIDTVSPIKPSTTPPCCLCSPDERRARTAGESSTTEPWDHGSVTEALTR